MKTTLVAALVAALTITGSHGSGGFSNFRTYANVPENNSFVRALAAPPSPHWPYGWVYVGRPTRHYYANGKRYEYAWCGAWEYAPRQWVVVLTHRKRPPLG